MIITKSIHKIQALRKQQVNKTWGFVPTMGALHAGHVSLIKQAKKENDVCIVSIFVNPKQFNNQNDLEQYPSDDKHDIKKLKDENVDILFIPEAADFYPQGFSTNINNLNLANKLEGASREGHFDGVCTVLTKFFNIVSPQMAYFGQKDAQQLLIVKKIVEDLNFDIEIKGCLIFRESSGLAFSSRNKRLTSDQTRSAIVLFQSLQLAKKLILEGETDSQLVIEKMVALIEETPAKIDYIAITDTVKLASVKKINQEVLISLAVFFGDVRLIDNIIIIP